MKKQLSPLLLVLTLFFACNEEPIETNKNTIQFSIVQKSTSNSRQLEEEVPSSVVLSIENESNEFEIENKKYSLTKINETYLIDPILLEVGNYNLSKFLVLNSADEVIYATPLEGSNLASLVDSPLPINFNIDTDSATNQNVEVIYTDSINPEDLGYASLSFNIVPTSNILYSVFGYSDANKNYSFLSGDLTVYGDQDSLFSIEYGDSINAVKLRNDYDTISLDFSAPGFFNSTVNISTDTLSKYKTIPLKVTLVKEENLWAYFPFSGNTYEVAGSSLSGTKQGAVLTNDRNEIENNAYYFDGINDYIKYGDNFDVGESDFTISTWTKVSEFKGLKPNTSTRGAYIVNKGLTIYGSPSRSGYGLIALSKDSVNEFGFYVGGNDQVFRTTGQNNFVANQWYHVVGVKKNDNISLYVDGVKISVDTVPSQLNTNNNIPFSIGTHDKLGYDAEGTSYFEGSIDEVKIYNRALTDEEVLELYNQ